MKNLFLLAVGMLMTLPTFAQTFEYTHEGQTVNYTVIDANEKIVMTQKVLFGGSKVHDIKGKLIIPATVNYRGVTYNVREIGAGSFKENTDLTSVVIPNSVTVIGGNAFSGCEALSSVVTTNSITEIGASAFFGCASLSSVVISNSVTKIDLYTFSGCSSLPSVEIPNSVTNIGDGAFSYCSSLSSVEIPNSVTAIGASAFQSCYSLTSVEIPDNVTTIADNSFANCLTLKDVVLPIRLETLGSKAFEGSQDIRNVVFRGPTPVKSTSDVFDNTVYEYATLYVRTGRVPQFMEASPWKYFFNITDETYSDIETVEADTDNRGIDPSKPCEVYNLSGAMISRHVQDLPAGIYIRAGRKILIR